MYHLQNHPYMKLKKPDTMFSMCISFSSSEMFPF